MPVDRPVRPSSTTSFAARTVPLFSGTSFSIVDRRTSVDHNRIGVKVGRREHPGQAQVGELSIPCPARQGV